MRVFGALRRALLRSGARILLDMTVTRGLTEANRALGVIVPSPAREATYRADRIILATGGLYGGGITVSARRVVQRAGTGRGTWLAHFVISRNDVVSCP